MMRRSRACVRRSLNCGYSFRARSRLCAAFSGVMVSISERAGCMMLPHAIWGVSSRGGRAAANLSLHGWLSSATFSSEKTAVSAVGVSAAGISAGSSAPSSTASTYSAANDDASTSIDIILDAVTSAMAEGLEERKVEKLDAPEDKDSEEAEAPAAGKRRRVRRNEAPAAEKVEVTEEIKEETPAAE